MISLIDEFAGCPLASCLREETLQEITADLPEIDGVKRGDSLANVPGEKLITIVKYPCDCEFETEYTDDLGYVMWHIAYHLAEMYEDGKIRAPHAFEDYVFEDLLLDPETKTLHVIIGS